VQFLNSKKEGHIRKTNSYIMITIELIKLVFHTLKFDREFVFGRCEEFLSIADEKIYTPTRIINNKFCKNVKLLISKKLSKKCPRIENRFQQQQHRKPKIFEKKNIIDHNQQCLLSSSL
jgi:hypothetical protein